VTLLLVAIVTAFGVAFYDARFPSNTLAAFVTSIVVGAASFSSLGLALTSVIPNADASPAVVNATILPLLFISGVFIPLEDPTAWYVTLSKAFPVFHFTEAMKSAFFSPTGNGFEPMHLLVVGGWGVAGLVLAVLFFSWEPRK
jgi:ABC-2 type transport system permease protein